MIDPPGVPIILNRAGIDPPGVPVKPLFENQLTRRAYTFLELPIYLVALSATMASIRDRAKAQTVAILNYATPQNWKQWIRPGNGYVH